MRVLSFDVGLRHLAFADLDILTQSHRYAIHQWDVIDVTGGARMPIEAMTDRLIEVLDNITTEHYDLVLIENQPCIKNPIMKSVQMVIFTYFSCMKCLVGNVRRVRLVSATNKLRLKHFQEDDAATTSYKHRKQVAVAAVRHYLVMPDGIIDGQRWLTYMQASKKKDDLCDCLLQAVAFDEQHYSLGKI